MGSHRTLRRSAVASILSLCVACASASPPDPEPLPVDPEAARPFLSERAFEDVRRQVAIGARDTGTPGAASARAYFRTELERLGLEVEELHVSPLGVVQTDAKAAPEEDATGPEQALAGTEPSPDPKADPNAGAKPDDESAAAAVEPAHPGFVHLRAVIPGTERPDVMLLGAVYDTAPKEDFTNLAANASASGPALVLEMARAIAARPLPYETWIVFIDGDGGGANAQQRTGSRAWAAALRDADELERIRLAFVFRQVCDPDLRFERDLFSHRVYREAIWRAARRKGATDVFPPEAGYTTPAAAHLSLLEGNVRRVVALVDDAYGGTEPPGAWSGTAEDNLDHCSAESLGVTGAVTLQTLDDLSAMLLKVDRLAGPPREPEPEASAPPVETPDATSAAPEDAALIESPAAETRPTSGGEEAPAVEPAPVEETP
jgi:hypothetical protein